MTRRTVSALALGALLLSHGVAAADALAPPPSDCPAGSIGRSAQVGTWCEPSPLCGGAQSSCPSEPYCAQPWHTPCPSPEPWRCSNDTIALCVRHETRTHRHPLLPDAPATTHELDVTTGACGEGGACPDGFTCQRSRRCVHGPASAEASAPSTTSAPSAVSEAEPSSVPAPVTATAASSCACRAARTRGSRGWLPLALLVLLPLRRRRATRDLEG